MSQIAATFQQAWQYHQANDLPRAEQLYRHILQVEPSHADAWCFLGAACQAQRKLTEAEQCLRRALQLAPDYPSAQNYLGIVLAEQGRYEESAACFQDLLRRHPDDADGHSNIGNVLVSLGRPGDAAAHCRQALALQPHYCGAYINLGNALREQRKTGEAIATFREALRLGPNSVEVHLNLGSLLRDQGDLDAAQMHYEAAQRLRPSNKLLVGKAVSLPPVYQSLADLQVRRQRLIDNIQELRRQQVVVDLERDEPGLDVPTLFYLAYHGLNDRDIQRDFAGLFKALSPADSTTARPRAAGKIRIGFLSRFFRNHTIGRLMGGMIANFSRDVFEVTVLPIAHGKDELAQFIQRSANHCVPLPVHAAAAARLVAQQQLDVLFYTDLGMEPISYTLAHARLAPVQVTTWGHPDTTGMDTIDHFISSEHLDTDEGQQHFTENLVRLKSLAIYYFKPTLPAVPKDRAHFGLTSEDHVYACPQSLFKFHPEFDDILGAILRGDPRGVLVLLQGPHPYWEKLLRQRFAKTLPDVLQRIRFVPFLDRPDFLTLMSQSDVLLDPLHFGGGNTTYEGLAFGTPIVTLPSAFLRGRITLALYQQMGVLDCVVKTPNEYVDLALRLGTNRDFRETVRRKILAANGVLYENSAGIRELEAFLQNV